MGTNYCRTYGFAVRVPAMVRSMICHTYYDMTRRGGWRIAATPFSRPPAFWVQMTQNQYGTSSCRRKLVTGQVLSDQIRSDQIKSVATEEPYEHTFWYVRTTAAVRDICACCMRHPSMKWIVIVGRSSF